MSIKITSVSQAIHQGARGYQEDSIVVVDGAKFHSFAVFDGLGGHAHGDEASAMAADQFQNFCEQKELHEIAMDADTLIAAMAEERRCDSYRTPSTTCVMVRFNKKTEQLEVYSVGDSFLIYVQDDKDFTIMSIPDESYRGGGLSAAIGASRCIDYRFAFPYDRRATKINLEPGKHRLIVATDGIERDLESFRKYYYNGSAETIVSSIISKKYSQQDNIAVIVVDLEVTG